MLVSASGPPHNAMPGADLGDDLLVVRVGITHCHEMTSSSIAFLTSISGAEEGASTPTTVPYFVRAAREDSCVCCAADRRRIDPARQGA